MEMVIPIALGVTLGLIFFRTLVRLSDPLIDWWDDQHWAAKTLLLVIIALLFASLVIA